MVAIKSGDADRIVAKPPESSDFYLIYGPDAGSVAERAGRIAAARADAADPFSLLKFDAGELASDPNRLADEAYAVSMFGGRRAILIRDGGSRPSLVGLIGALMDRPPPETTLVVQAGELRKGHALLALFERSKTALAIPCYVDDDAAVGRLIEEETRAARLAIDPDARAALMAHLGGDRMLSRGEIRKLCLYCHGEERIQLQHVEDLIGDSSAVTVEEVIDAAATGDVAATSDRLQRAAGEGISPDRIASTALRHFMQLDEWRIAVDAGRRPADVIDGARPPVHFKRKAKVGIALGLWTGPRIEKALGLLADVMRDQRLSASLSAEIVADALITIARVAGQSARQRG